VYEALGLSRKTLWEKMQKHGIDKAAFGDIEDEDNRWADFPPALAPDVTIPHIGRGLFSRFVVHRALDGCADGSRPPHGPRIPAAAVVRPGSDQETGSWEEPT
jgi:hypothetical protein